MRRIRRAIVLAMVLVCFPLPETRAEGNHPSYLILPPSRPVGYVVPTDRPRYAYGWFGVPPRRPQWSRHFGFYRNYTQWTAK